jgi:hypothetical protein
MDAIDNEQGGGIIEPDTMIPENPIIAENNITDSI